MKQVLSSGIDVAHAWAHQTQEYARNSGDTFYFRGDTIYSYGNHYPIATIVNSATTGNKAILFNTKSYSSTTAKHKSWVRSAIPYSDNVIEVPNVGERLSEKDHEENIQSFIERVEEYVGRQRRARVSNYMPDITKTIQMLKDYVELYGLRATLDDKTTSLMEQEFDEEMQKEIETTLKERADRILAKRQEDIDKWLSGESNKTAIAGIDTGQVYLRKSEDVVQTSKGIEVPVGDALKLYDAICRVRTSIVAEEQIMAYIEKHGLGTIVGYRINKITPNGDLVAGCHRIMWKEIDRFAKSQGWENKAK